MKMRLYGIIIFLLFFASSMISQDCFSAKIFDVKVEQSCLGNEVSRKLVIDHFKDHPISIKYLGSTLESLRFIYDNQNIPRDSFIHFRENEELNNIWVEFVIEDLETTPEFYLEQKYCDVSFVDTIKVLYAHYFVNSKVKEILVSDACVETISLNLPFAGTQTDIKFFEYKGGKYEFLFSGTYYCCSYGNIIKLKKNSTNKYKIGITGCHSPYQEFEIELK